MRIPKGTGAILMGIAVLIIGHSYNPSEGQIIGEIQTGTGKMTVLFNGVENGHLGFGDEKWAPEDTRSASIDILNEGDIDFRSTLDSGDYAVGSIVNEFHALVTTEDGKVLFAGPYSEVFIKNLDIPAGDSEKLKLAVQWLPPENTDFSVSRNDSFNMQVNAQQKIG